MSTIIADQPLLRVELAGQPRGAVLRCVGEIDLSNVDSLREALDSSIHLGVPEVEVDLREVVFLDSSVIMALAAASHQLAGEGRTLCVRTGAWIAHLLRMVKLDCLLKVRVD